MFAGMDLNGKRVAELACGTGTNTLEVLKQFPEAEIIGLDISPNSCAAYTQRTGRPSFVFDLSMEHVDLPTEVDVAFVVGGLHHCSNDLPATLNNVKRILAPGGILLMVEPNASFFLNRLREIWYKYDRWFRDEEETPLDHASLASLAGPDFKILDVLYLGGIAYFLILNSLITRFPLGLKNALAPVLFAFDDVYHKLPGKRPFPMFLARWQKLH